MNNGRVILNKIHLALFTTSLRRLFSAPLAFPPDRSGVLLLTKNLRQCFMRVSCYC